MDIPATSLDTILSTQNACDAPRAALPWYGKLLATGVLALAPLVRAYAEEPAKPDAPTSCITLTKEDENYIKKFDDKVKVVKMQTPTPTEDTGGLPGAYNVLGDKAREAKRNTESVAYYTQSIQANSKGWWPYWNLAQVYLDVAAGERDPKAKTAFYKKSVIYGETAITIVSEKKTASEELENPRLVSLMSLIVGKTLYDLNERKGALHYLELSKRLTPTRFDNTAVKYLADLQKNPPK